MSAPSPTIGLVGWLLLIVRVLLMLALLLVCLPCYYLWRLLGLGRFWPRIFLSGIGRIVGMRLTVRGTPRQNALYLSNHVSWLDIPVIASASGSAFVAHDGLATNPVLRWLCRLNDTVFIARHRRTDVAGQASAIRLTLDDVGALTLFPEGTTSDGESLLPFKSALLSAIDPLPEGVAVQPVLLAYQDPRRIAWLGEEHGLDNFKRIAGSFRHVHVTAWFLEPLAGAALNDRKTMAAAASQAVAVQLQAI
jgi:1-acyl-sn-glycerol-3-phosphate acyltransferase